MDKAWLRTGEVRFGQMESHNMHSNNIVILESCNCHIYLLPVLLTYENYIHIYFQNISINLHYIFEKFNIFCKKISL